MFCKNCNDSMNYISGNQNGGYYVCNKCGNMVVTGTTSKKENCCGGNGPNCKCK